MQQQKTRENPTGDMLPEAKRPFSSHGHDVPSAYRRSCGRVNQFNRDILHYYSYLKLYRHVEFILTRYLVDAEVLKENCLFT